MSWAPPDNSDQSGQIPDYSSQRGPEAQEIFRLGILPDGASDPLHGMIVLLGLERQQPHQMKGVRMSGIQRQRLPATNLGIERLPHAQVVKSGFIERGRRSGGGRSVRLCLLPEAAGPAFATIHQRIST